MSPSEPLMTSQPQPLPARQGCHSWVCRWGPAQMHLGKRSWRGRHAAQALDASCEPLVRSHMHPEGRAPLLSHTERTDGPAMAQPRDPPIQTFSILFASCLWHDFPSDPQGHGDEHMFGGESGKRQIGVVSAKESSLPQAPCPKHHLSSCLHPTRLSLLRA